MEQPALVQVSLIMNLFHFNCSRNDIFAFNQNP